MTRDEERGNPQSECPDEGEIREHADVLGLLGEEIPTGTFRTVGERVEAMQKIASRRVYKATDCGAWLAFRGDAEVGEVGITVGSIVEGADFGTEEHTLDYPFTADAFWSSLDEIEKEASYIWKQTHGCESCWPEGTADDWGNEFEPGEVGGPINPNCPECQGEGAVL